MPQGYVPAPTDPAYYDALAATKGGVVLNQLQDAGRAAVESYTATKSAMNDKDETRRLARQLRDALVQEGVSESMANAAALEYAKQGTQELMKAYTNRQQVAADIKAKNATTAQAQATTAEIAPNAAADRALTGARTAGVGAETAQTQTETSLMEPRFEFDKSYRDRELTARIDKETRDFVQSFDADKDMRIDASERQKLLIANLTKLRSEVKSAKNTPSSDRLKPDVQRLMNMGDDEILTEAKRRTDEYIKDYEWSVNNATDKPAEAGGGGMDASGATQQAIDYLTGKTFKSGTTVGDLTNKIQASWPGADVQAVLSAIHYGNVPNASAN